MNILQSAMNIQPNDQEQEQAYVAAMTGQEVWFLLDKGYQPLGLVMGTCIFGVGSLKNLVNTAKGNIHGEVKDYSVAMYQARALAFSRMQFEADQLGADGIIVNLLDLKYLHGNQWIEAAVKGTAVRYVGTESKKLPSQHGKVVIAVKGSDRKQEPLARFE